MKMPNIQQLLRRHVFGRKAERERIEDAMAGVKVTENLVREAVHRGLALARAGNKRAARKALVEAEQLLELQAKYRKRLD
jgi:hypothetical protein